MAALEPRYVSFRSRTRCVLIEDDAERGGSPIFASLAMISALGTPSSFASSYTLTFGVAPEVPARAVRVA
jgi:hypothetical protein